MSHWTGSCGSPLFNEILRRSAENNEGEFYQKTSNIIDPEKLKTLYLEMLDEKNFYAFNPSFDKRCNK